VPADSFYEWKKTGSVKLPYSIGMKGYQPFVFAGLWEGWKAPGSDEWLRTCTILTILTCEPNEFVATIHNRMPVILQQAVRGSRVQNVSAAVNLQATFASLQMDESARWLHFTGLAERLIQ
jgi:putative SOS response-associated peptidase YedK